MPSGILTEGVRQNRYAHSYLLNQLTLSILEYLQKPPCGGRWILRSKRRKESGETTSVSLNSIDTYFIKPGISPKPAAVTKVFPKTENDPVAAGPFSQEVVRRKEELCFGYFIRGTNTRETMVISFMSMFMLGPEVSLKGSPTVSPTTAAL